MKKIIALTLAVLMIFSVSATAMAAVEYEQPFNKGTLGSQCFRIPALLTLNDGSVLAAADLRYSHGADSPNNLEIVVAKSDNGYNGWSHKLVNYFGDYPDNVTNTGSASFIDSALIQSEKTGRIFLISDAFPSGGGYPNALTGTGFDSNGRLLLTTGDVDDSLDTFGYYVGAMAGGRATVYNRSSNTATAYSIDAEYNLYKNGEALYMNQVGTSNKVQQNVFYNEAELCCYRTCYLIMRYSDDNGKTWSAPVNLSAQIKNGNESFLGICPGRGFVTNYQGKERIIFCVYDNAGGKENVSTIYSDDNGITWKRGAETKCKAAVGKTSESQIVELNGGVLRMFARNNYDFVAYADSTDGGHSWSEFSADQNLIANGNCMMSFINTDIILDGKKVVLGSYPSNTYKRCDGCIMVGLYGDDNVISWETKYFVTDGYYAYSCLTQLSDGNIGLLFEDEEFHIQYRILKISEDGEVDEINKFNEKYEGKIPFWQAIINAFKYLIYKIQNWFGRL